MPVTGGPNIITDGLIFYWDAANPKCYPESGVTCTDLIYNTNWTVNGSINFEPETKSFDFAIQDTQKYIVTTESFVFTSDSSALTYDFWCWLSSSNPSSLPSIFYDRSQGATPYIWIYESGGNLGVQYSNNEAAQAKYFSFFTGYTDSWINGVVTFQYGGSEEAEINVYRNGSYLGKSNPGSIALFPSEDVTKTIGNYGASSSMHNWSGKYAINKVYNRIISNEEILHNYNELKSRFELL